MLRMRHLVGIVMPLVMFKYNSALVDRPTQLIEQRTQQVFLLCVQVCFCLCSSRGGHLRLLDCQGDEHWNTVCAGGHLCLFEVARLPARETGISELQLCCFEVPRQPCNHLLLPPSYCSQESSTLLPRKGTRAMNTVLIQLQRHVAYPLNVQSKEKKKIISQCFRRVSRSVID